MDGRHPEAYKFCANRSPAKLPFRLAGPFPGSFLLIYKFGEKLNAHCKALQSGDRKAVRASALGTALPDGFLFSPRLPSWLFVAHPCRAHTHLAPVVV